MKIITLLAFTTLLASGCSNPMMYDWGGYGNGKAHSIRMVEYTVGAASLEETIESSYRHIERLENAGKKVPPGVYAELGTLYLEAGNLDQSIKFYNKEKSNWPESSDLMDKLIKTLDDRKSRT